MTTINSPEPPEIDVDRDDNNSACDSPILPRAPADAFSATRGTSTFALVPPNELLRASLRWRTRFRFVLQMMLQAVGP